ncbi:Oidioi.mRNA.OKI2018_I69.PAR.g9501.t1.cds [Oikopleura dioica]|uniref:Oidioi.mRNA.OKI2018_I69.PAR.g9501.t1.cds n=1 Tax=Oikopleura dioica TaxID=34765 RepID=A0ABN7RLW9_OIKDI|nr:Oidioi.mRNA.OKI2018_I69.PAR.g9501.t1.cds [Oikopleura dioica]
MHQNNSKAAFQLIFGSEKATNCQLPAPVLDCDCDKLPANGPEAEGVCEEVDRRSIKMLFTCPTNPANSKRFRGKCRQVSKAKSFSLPMPCGELDCRCKDEMAIFAADRGAASQCWSGGKNQHIEFSATRTEMEFGMMAKKEGRAR